LLSKFTNLINMKKHNYLFSLALSAAVLFSCGGGTGDTPADTQAEPAADPNAPAVHVGQAAVDTESNNILNIAIGSPDHTTLVAAVQAATIENVLANNGPITVFAPVNSAFEKLPEGTVETLLKPENKSALINILYFHASAGSFEKEALKDGMMMDQAQGDKVKIEVKGEDVFIGGAKILASVKASNGYVHVIDGVLLPPEK